MADLDKLRGLLAQAEARVDDLRTAIRVLEQLHGVEPAAAPLITVRRTAMPLATGNEGKLAPKPKGPGKGSPGPKGQRPAIIAALTARGSWMSVQEVIDATGLPRKVIANALNNMKAGGKVDHDKPNHAYRLRVTEQGGAD